MGQVAFGDALLPLRAVAWTKSTQKSKRQISCVKNATFRPEKWRWASPAQGFLFFIDDSHPNEAVNGVLYNQKIFLNGLHFAFSIRTRY